MPVEVNPYDIINPYDIHQHDIKTDDDGNIPLVAMLSEPIPERITYNEDCEDFLKSQEYFPPLENITNFITIEQFFDARFNINNTHNSVYRSIGDNTDYDDQINIDGNEQINIYTGHTLELEQDNISISQNIHDHLVITLNNHMSDFLYNVKRIQYLEYNPYSNITGISDYEDLYHKIKASIFVTTSEIINYDPIFNGIETDFIDLYDQYNFPCVSLFLRLHNIISYIRRNPDYITYLKSYVHFNKDFYKIYDSMNRGKLHEKRGEILSKINIYFSHRLMNGKGAVATSIPKIAELLIPLIKMDMKVNQKKASFTYYEATKNLFYLLHKYIRRSECFGDFLMEKSDKRSSFFMNLIKKQ